MAIPARTSPKAASYFRKRPFLTPEVCQKYRMGHHRGQEIYGQEEWNDQAVEERISELGVLLPVEGPNDRIGA